TGIGLAVTISACDNGSIATEIVVLRSPNFIRLNKTKFINDDPKTANAPIAIGVPVSPNNAVNAIELKGAVATTVIIPPSTIPISTGLEVVESLMILPICNNVASTTGATPIAIIRVIGAMIIIEPIK